MVHVQFSSIHQDKSLPVIFDLDQRGLFHGNLQLHPRVAGFLSRPPRRCQTLTDNSPLVKIPPLLPTSSATPTAAPAVNNPTILFSPLGHCSLALPAPYFRCILKLADCFSVLFKGYRREWRIQSPATARFVVEDQEGRSVNQPGWLLELGQSRVAVRVCSEPHSMPDQSWDSESCTIGNYSLGYTNTPACPDCRCRDSL